MIIGLGTLINVVAIIVGTVIGVLVGNRLSEKTSRVVTDGLGLVVLVLGGLNVMSLLDQEFVSAVGAGIPLLVVIGAILIGGIIGSALKIEQRLEQLGTSLQKRFAGKGTKDSKEKFITGFVNASLVFTIGPLAILGALSDGLGQGIEQLATKSILDAFASLAFAASLGWGVALSAIPVGIWQGLITVLAFSVGAVVSAPIISALTATGGVLLLGVGLRLLQLRQVAVGNMLPALIVAPLITLLLMVI
ncbi:unannotated protein [freshwater metagenome]|uniref:Unannotated protein n=1 Tax=freshwater metagenome TaxID=449393 RepID=A0A6J6DRR8_9ZZZZ